jgi:hypothetical protein
VCKAYFISADAMDEGNAQYSYACAGSFWN